MNINKLYKNILLLVLLLIASCSSYSTIHFRASNEAEIVVADIVSSYGLVASDRPWIRSYNRWATSISRKVTRSWEGTFQGDSLMIVEIIDETHCTLLVDLDFGTGDSVSIALEVSAELEESDIDAVIKTETYFRLN